MMNIIKLCVSMASNFSGGIIKKYVNNKYENNLFSYNVFNCIVSVTAAFVLLVFAENLKFSAYTVILGILFGVITLLQQIFNLLALEKGPFSYTTVIISLSTLIPTLSGAIFWDERISFLQYFGIAFMLISLVLSVNFLNKKNSVNLLWILFSIIAFLCTGFIGVMQKIHQTSEYKNELDGFLIIAFFVSFVVSFILSLLLKNSQIRSKDNKKSVFSLLYIILLVISGIFVALNNKLNLYLSGIIDSAIFFPVVNGGGLVLSTFAAITIFKEKLSLLQKIGLVCGIISVILLCLNF